MVFKGGTAISFFYGNNRFSEDLDFSSEDDEGYAIIDDALESFQKLHNYSMINNWEDEIEQSSSRFRRYHLEFGYGEYSTIRASIDYSIGACELGYEGREIGNGYRAAVVNVMKPEELVAEKVRAIYTRLKGRDLYDLYYLTVIMKTRISKGLILKKFEEDNSLKGSKYSMPSFKERIVELKPYWKDLKGILNDFDALSFDKVERDIFDAFRLI